MTRLIRPHPWLTRSLPVVMPLLATLVSLGLAPLIPSADLAMIYLAGVLITALYSRVRPALVCALLSFLAYNFFLTEPHYSLQMFHSDDVLTALLLVMVAITTGHLAARLNEKVTALSDSQRWNEQQMICARALSVCVDPPMVMHVFAEQLRDAFSCDVIDMTDDSAPPTDTLEQGIGWQAGDTAITFWFCNPGGQLQRKLCMPRPLGLRQESVGIQVETLASLARLAWNRVMLAESLRQETLVKEREQLRSALLSSISHDLRTPLSTMIGSVSSLIDLAEALDPDLRAELLTNTLSEAMRLDRYIQKLLDMTRLGHGELALDRDWVGVDDILSVVLRRLRPLQGDIDVQLHMADDLPLLHVHPALIEQAVFNVLENAMRFSPKAGVIEIAVSGESGWTYLDVSDAGPGIDTAVHEAVFDMFHTFSHGDQYATGTGLGLAICRGILGAHGGTVQVRHSAPGHGTTFRLSLPFTRPEHSEARA
ncbi:sensor histidine kinase [Pseudomonas saliphila]|uniref:sensor histidine kinase n=1 Tax=Pseudomonas saliphila TaxID=2586906 RepID=UPI001239D3DD|nr:ATP-binding protein [Pseudomonas saliphila]